MSVFDIQDVPLPVADLPAPFEVRKNRHGEWWIYDTSGATQHAVARVYVGGATLAGQVAALPLLVHVCQLVLDGASWPEVVIAAHAALAHTLKENEA